MERAVVVKIKLLRTYSTYYAGRVLDCEDAVAVRLIKDGIAERDPPQVDDPPVVETASVEHVAETADMTPRRIVKHHRER